MSKMKNVNDSLVFGHLPKLTLKTLEMASRVLGKQ